MTKREFQELLDKYLDGKCSDEEVQLLTRFYDSFQENEDWPEALGQKERYETDLFARINQNIDRVERSECEETRRSWFSPVMKMAASISIIASLGVFSWTYFNSSVPRKIASIEKVTAKGQKSTLVLRDGTEVRLNSESKLTFPEQFGTIREVVLEGEAFFDVARDVNRPFIIRSGDITTTVLGTSFNVRAFPEEDIEVTVATGKVRVTTGGKSSLEGRGPEPGERRGVFLTPNEQATFHLTSGVFEKREVNIERYLAWKEGIIHFEEVELREAAKTLERWYGVTITFANERIQYCKIQSGTYEDENLYNILQSFEYFLGIEFEVSNGNQITISGEGCPASRHPEPASQPKQSKDPVEGKRGVNPSTK